MPECLPSVHRDALEGADIRTFTRLELDAVQRVQFEIQQTLDYGDASWGEGFSESIAKAEAPGRAEAVLAFLEARGIEVSRETRARIAACTDIATLNWWIARAAAASCADDVVVPV